MDNTAELPELLLTRLILPALGQSLLLRPRLIDLLDQAEIYALTLITAPAGSGKSSLLASWAIGQQNPVAWFSVETGDNDPVRFWRYFTAALQRAVPSLKFPVQLIQPPVVSGAFHAGLDQLCNALVSHASTIFLVLDDVQQIENPEIYTSLGYLLEHQPANFHMLLASRNTPALPLTRMRVKNRLLQVRSHEINFTNDELAAFLAKIQPAGLSQEQIRRVADLTRGWAAGIRLMALALTERPDWLDAWSEGKKMTSDYLAAEVIGQMPVNWIDFLEKVAVFEQFNLDMALAVTNSSDVIDLLAHISEADLFLQRQDSTYQLHPFFREVLLQRLPEDAKQLLNQQVAAWFEINGNPEKAIAHATAGKDWDRAVRLILQSSQNKFQSGEIRTLEGWVQSIPALVQLQFPDLQLLSGWICYLAGKVPEAQKLAVYLEDANQQVQIRQKGWWAGLRCQLALVQEQNRQALELARIALAETDSRDLFMRGILLSSLATAQQALGDSAEAAANFKQAMQVNRRVGNLLMSVFGLVSLGMELNNQGQRPRALVLCSEALDEFIGSPQGDYPITGMIYILQARLDWESNHLDQAQKVLKQGTESIKQLGMPGILMAAEFSQAQILAAREDYSKALKLINANRKLARTGEFTGYKQMFDMLRAEIYLKMGNLAAVENWLENAYLPIDPQEDPAREMEFILKARYLVEIGSLNEARPLLDALEIYAQQSGHARIAIPINLTKAALERKNGQLERTNQYLKAALLLAVPGGYIRLLLDGGSSVLGMLAQLPGAPQEIRSMFRPVNSSNASGLVEMLTSRENDVLRLLADNHTNAEIARELVVSSETVKVHMKHIFQKLDVSDRRQAVRRARQLELI
ncbi:MAG: LuxR C-terminal-related transcriptional regulator [Anaerolineaceae bacterium]|nr:LuxR C-terminal-related transcriptional regulator [Anaerolineaceae bacterium]